MKQERVQLHDPRPQIDLGSSTICSPSLALALALALPREVTRAANPSIHPRPYYRHREAFFNPVSGHWEKDDLQSLGSSSENSTPHSEAGVGASVDPPAGGPPVHRS